MVSKQVFWITLSLFLSSRIIVFNSTISATHADVNTFAEIAYAYKLSQNSNTSLSQTYKTLTQHKIAQTTSQSKAKALKTRSNIEYPPLAIAFFASIPTIPIGNKFNEATLSKSKELYRFRFPLTLIIFDFILLLCLLLLLKKNPFPWKQAAELTSYYTLMGCAFHYLLYQRYDLLIPAFILISILLIGRRQNHLGLFFLAFVSHLKLMPLAIIPIVLYYICAIQAQAKKISIGKYLTYFSSFLASFSLITLVLNQIFQLNQFEFLIYHSNRPVQVESTYAHLIYFANLVGIKMDLVHSYGSFNLVSNIEPILRNSSLYLAIVACVVLYRHIYPKYKLLSQYPQDNQLFHLVRHIIVLILVLILCSKVFSPQYLLWVLPLAPVVFLQSPRLTRYAGYGLLILIAIITTALFPYLYIPHVLGFGRGPSILGEALLLLRNFSIFFLVIYILRYQTYLEDQNYSASKR